MLIRLRRRRILASILAIVVVCGVSAAVLMGRPGDQMRSDPHILGTPQTTPDDGALPVKVIHPRRDSSFGVTLQQLATVEPFFQANLRARASGTVRFVQKDIGDRVTQGELLVEIDEPDLVQEVAQKEAVIGQRQQELAMARHDITHADALLDVARATHAHRQAEVEEKRVAAETRLRRLNRFKQLSSRQVVDEGAIDEEEGFYRAAVAAQTGAEMAVKKAEADVREKQASLEGVRAEIMLKDALVEVARRDRDRAAAMLNYARVTAPFDGIVTQRNVDRGAFVQNATSANTEALVSIARTDIVTVVMQLPDNAAPYISRDTGVELQLNELPGVSIHGKVTRYTPAIRGTDRTVRVEMDLFNGGAAAYGRFVAKATACGFAAAAAEVPVQALSLIAAGQDVWRNQKGCGDPIPPQPLVVGGTAAHLLPGMGGTARVQLQEFGESFLLPSSAVFSLGGMPNVLEVHNGKTRFVPVRVQVNDGRLAKVAVVERPAGGRGGGREVVREFTGAEQIVASRQLEIGEGQAVRASPEDW